MSEGTANVRGQSSEWRRDVDGWSGGSLMSCYCLFLQIEDVMIAGFIKSSLVIVLIGIFSLGSTASCPHTSKEKNCVQCVFRRHQPLELACIVRRVSVSAPSLPPPSRPLRALTNQQRSVLVVVPAGQLLQESPVVHVDAGHQSAFVQRLPAVVDVVALQGRHPAPCKDSGRRGESLLERATAAG